DRRAARRVPSPRCGVNTWPWRPRGPTWKRCVTCSNGDGRNTQHGRLPADKAPVRLKTSANGASWLPVGIWGLFAVAVAAIHVAVPTGVFGRGNYLTITV